MDIIKSQKKLIANTVNYVKNLKWEKTTERERDSTMSMVITIGFSEFRWTWSPSTLEEISYLYKSCQIDKAKKFYSVWTFKFFISTVVWVVRPSLNRYRRESISIWVVCAWLQMRTNCSREVIASFEWELGLKIEISVIGSDSFTNYPTRSKFELDEGIGLNILEVATRRTPIWG